MATPIAMGELEMSVDPALGFGWKLLGREFAGGQHDLPKLAAGLVAVRVNRDKVVIKSEELDLVVTLKQRPLVPKADVLNRSLVSGDDFGIQLATRRMAPGRETLQAVSLPGELDIMREVRLLPRQFARFHQQSLDQAGEDASCQKVQSDPHTHSPEDQTIGFRVKAGDQ